VPEINANFPDYTKAILAWRGWNIEDDFYLTSINREYGVWGLVYTRAKCRSNNHPHEKAPVYLCGGSTRGCGLYGVFNMNEVPAIHSGNPMIPIGLAAYWGKAFLGAQGIRAEFAKPYCLIASKTDDPHIHKDTYDFYCREVSNLYEIPILHVDEAMKRFEDHLPLDILESETRKKKLTEGITSVSRFSLYQKDR
jgi:hypothetical protein